MLGPSENALVQGHGGLYEEHTGQREQVESQPGWQRLVGEPLTMLPPLGGPFT